MIRRQFSKFAVASLAALSLGAGSVSAADYPEKPITLIVPLGAGGSHEWYEWHHLLFGYEWIVLVCFTVNDLSVTWNVQPDLCGQPACIFTYVVSIQVIVIVGVFRRTERLCCECRRLLSIKAVATILADRIHQLIEDLVDGKNLFFCNAKEVVIKCSSFNN